MTDTAAQLTAADRAWLDTLDVAEPLPPIPSGVALLDVLTELAVPHEDLGEILRLRPRLDDHEAGTVAARILSGLHRGLGSATGLGHELDLRRCDDPLLRYAAMYAFAAMDPVIRRWHLERSVPPDVSRRTLADLGRQLTNHRRRIGRGGMSEVGWMSNHFQGRLYQLGRLQFELVPLGRTTSAEVRAGGVPAEPGDPAIAVHIPDYCGPIDDGACAESFAAALEFFPRHFPDHRPIVFTCHSWLLDPQLAERLPADSNITAFQRRFTITHRRADIDDAGAFLFVFGTRDVDARAGLPRRSSLQRALIDHLDNGGHWYGGAGWRTFEA
ncbi:acyltransferase domain-containing protein [Microlunatus speluncae]|uniref:acyltransferase domain-containing protein n=1 Tax=Microlunatus speluncae TaxID=2594267 RepID=UPI001266797E|nr:acyltransferase domain-containing protein [Microlunatus speluncae]